MTRDAINDIPIDGLALRRRSDCSYRSKTVTVIDALERSLARCRIIGDRDSRHCLLSGCTDFAIVIDNDPQLLLLFASSSSTSDRQQFSDASRAQSSSAEATIRNCSVPLPPTKAEQEAIAEALSDADALIESLEQLIAKKRHIKQGAMQELLTGKKRLPGFSGEWRDAERVGRDCQMIRKLVGVIDELSPRSYCDGTTMTFDDANMSMATISGHSRTDISLNVVSTDSRLQDGDVLF